MNQFYEEPIKSNEELFSFLKKSTDRWVYRGQLFKYPLTSTLERACGSQGRDLRTSASKVERETVRQFRRSYDGNDREDVRMNSLYCLSLMRHYGAPTRLLDWTYSKYVAVYFALESMLNEQETGTQRKCAIWSINGDWCTQEATSVAGDKVKKRGLDNVRNEPKNHETSFKELYLDNKYNFVLPENPYYFHQRLQIQQAVLLCPGNITIKFEDNIRQMKHWDEKSSIIKYVYEAPLDKLVEAMETLLRMNISRRTLFPGLSGLAESLQYPLKFFESVYDMHEGV